MPHFPSKPHDSSDEHVDAVARDRRIRIKNRRKRYLDLHPDYFKEPHLELAGRIISHRAPSQILNQSIFQNRFSTIDW